MGDISPTRCNQRIDESIEEEARIKEQLRTKKKVEAEGRNGEWDTVPKLNFVNVESTSSEPTGTLTQADADADERPFKKRIYRARWDFQPREEDELEVCTGQLVRILSTFDDGWANCLLISGMKFGLVPLNHLERYFDCLRKSCSGETPAHGSSGSHGSDNSENGSSEYRDNKSSEGNGTDDEHSNNQNSDNENLDRGNSGDNRSHDEGSNDRSEEEEEGEEEEDDEGSGNNSSDDEYLARIAERIVAQTAREEDNSSDDEDPDSESSEDSSADDEDLDIMAGRIATHMMWTGILRHQMIKNQMLRTRM